MYLSEYYCFTSVRVTYRIDTKKDVKLSCYCSLHVMRLLRMALQVETSNAESPTPIC